MRKPRLIVSCVANGYAQPGERIAEFSFPEVAGAAAPWMTADALPGGLIRLAYREGKAPLVEVYRTTNCEVALPATVAAIINAALALVDEDAGALEQNIGALRSALDAHFPETEL